MDDKNIRAGRVPESLLKKITSYREFGLLLAFAAILVIAAFATPKMFQPEALHQMLRNYAVFGILAIGMLGVMLTGGIDLSVGSTLALSGLVSTQLMIAGTPVLFCILGAAGAGLLCGLLNGLLVGKLNMLPLIATLATMYIIRGVAYILCHGKWMMPNIYTHNYTIVALGQPLVLYNILVIYIVVLIAASIFFSQIRLGRRIYAVGSSPDSALVAGIDVGTIRLAAYLIMGTLVGLGGFLYTSNYAVWEPQTGSGFEMEVIAICVLGGTSISGGTGKTGGVFIATLLMSVVSYFLSMLPGMSVWKMGLQGALIIVAVAVNILTAKLSVATALKARIL
jgi:rhamnose transport system permease protein